MRSAVPCNTASRSAGRAFNIREAHTSRRYFCLLIRKQVSEVAAASHRRSKPPVLAELPTQPCALHRLMLHDQSGSALMRLAAEGIALHEAPLAPPPYERTAEGACSPAALPGTLSTFRGRGAQR